jgi:hypothetical protein
MTAVDLVPPYVYSIRFEASFFKYIYFSMEDLAPGSHHFKYGCDVWEGVGCMARFSLLGTF